MCKVRLFLHSHPWPPYVPLRLCANIAVYFPLIMAAQQDKGLARSLKRMESIYVAELLCGNAERDASHALVCIDMDRSANVSRDLEISRTGISRREHSYHRVTRTRAIFRSCRANSSRYRRADILTWRSESDVLDVPVSFEGFSQRETRFFFFWGDVKLYFIQNIFHRWLQLSPTFRATSESFARKEMFVI